MGLHNKFPKSPYAILDPSVRWFPADEQLREKGYGKLLPPLVAKLRVEVKTWRDNGYKGASKTSISLLKWWFETEHLMPSEIGDMLSFKYYFAQREAVETIIYLYEVVEVKDKFDLMRFDSSKAISESMFPESWRRFVIKMATGLGKTKVLALVLAWSYFHKLYEPDSGLARNFLVITPNIIVLDRIRADFDGLKIFFSDPILPENGINGQNWKDDFQMTLHIQDNVNITKKVGNIFLTNIHRVYEGNDRIPSAEDDDTSEYFLGENAVNKTSDSKVDLSVIVREVDELVILNDEAHHIHREDLAWFKSIEDIHNRLLQKDGVLSLQIDVTATPRHDNGAIFVQTVCDYPLVEAIYQNVVKHPVVPDAASRVKLLEKKTSKYSQKYEDYIHLGYLEWKKVYDKQIKVGKKSVLFIMTDDTKNCDEVAEYLENRYSEFKGATLVIHTKHNGDIAEAGYGKKEEELKILRDTANNIDKLDNPYKVIVSVLMLKEGWDVKNVTTIVGLRPFSSKSNILPEQTIGRGLRRMYRGQDVTEYVSVIGTTAFMDFVEQIKGEGVELEMRKMTDKTEAVAPIVVEVDMDDKKKNIEKLDIEIPVLSPRIYREYKNLSELDVSKFGTEKIKIREFSDAEKREIVFKYVVSQSGKEDETHHTTILETDSIPDFTAVIGFFAQNIMKELRLVSGYDILYEKVKIFVREYLFEKSVDLEDMNTLRNLSENEASRTIVETFKKKINELTILDKGEAEIRDYIKISKCRPFIVKDQGYLIPKKSVFNKIVGDSHLELRFANTLEKFDDIISYAKNYYGVHFKIGYKNADGNISDYYPDFFVKKSEKEVYIIETKGLEDLDVPPKMLALKQWCVDVNKSQKKIKFDYVFVDEDGFNKYEPRNFADVIRIFKEYR